MTYRPHYTFIFTPISSHQEVQFEEVPAKFASFKSLLLIGTSNSMFDLPVLRFLKRIQESNWFGLLQLAYYFSLWMSLILSLPSGHRSLNEVHLPSPVSLHIGKFSLCISHFKVPTVNSSSEHSPADPSLITRVLIFQLFGFRTEVVDAGQRTNCEKCGFLKVGNGNSEK